MGSETTVKPAIQAEIPRALQPGATIAFISSSAPLNDLPERGYNVRTFYKPDTGIQSSITNRLSEIRAAFLDPTISAIICTIGGPSLTELLPALKEDTEHTAHTRGRDIQRSTAQRATRRLVGYSDISGLHWFLYAVTGLRTFYGPGAIPELGAPGSVNDEASPLAFSVKHLFNAIENPEPILDISRSPVYAPKLHPFFKDPTSTNPVKLSSAPSWTWLRPGKAQVWLFRGCLTVVVRINGVRSIAPDWRGRIVFLETATGDDNESGNLLSRVRAALADLIAQGVFDEAAELRREAFANVVRGLFCEGRLAKKPFPVLFNVDFGYAVPMVTLSFDALAELDSENDRFAIL
ncbi:hypothetical protein GQ53DRAFT_778557 [Thozetella sp. PMI_491]|nr:hypothetical protein GQ53DRAFT_778557 [Thozetella sp. PMI_491]